MLQATVCNSGTLDAKAFCEDCLSSPEVDISRSEVVEALVIADWCASTTTNTRSRPVPSDGLSKSMLTPTAS